MSKTTKIISIICATVVLITIAVLSYMSGEGITMADSLQALGVFVSGLLVAFGMRRGGSAVVIVLAMGVSQVACTPKPQVMAQASLTSVAEAVAAGDSLVASMIPDASQEAIVTAMRGCIGYPGDCDQLELYQDAMEPWENAVEGFEHAVASLHLFQAAIDMWVAIGHLGNGSSDLCVELGESVSALISLLDVVGVEVPGVIIGATPAIDMVCHLVAVEISGEEK